MTKSGNNPGLRTRLPIATANKVKLPRNGTISFIAADGDCMDGVENPVFSPDQTMLHIETYGKDNTLLSTTLDGVVGIRGAKGPGTYQVCFKPPALGSNFMGTGLAVTLQNMFVRLIVNEASPNRGKPADAADTVGHRPYDSRVHTSIRPCVSICAKDLLSGIYRCLSPHTCLRAYKYRSSDRDATIR